VTFIHRIGDGSCENELHVPSWTLKRFKPGNSLEVKNIMLDLDEEIESSTGGEWFLLSFEQILMYSSTPVFRR